MARSKSSARWLDEHFRDPFVRRAHVEGKRSRAAYKLEELLERDLLLKPGMSIVDLGAAPGGWSQVAADRLKGRGRVIGLDILPMAELPGVEFLQGDFTTEESLNSLEAALGGEKVDLVMSDMAPNMSGVGVVDQDRSMVLVELALDFARQALKYQGGFLVKVFQGEGFDALLKQLRAQFNRVLVRKPKASRSRSREVYILATGYKARP